MRHQARLNGPAALGAGAALALTIVAATAARPASAQPMMDPRQASGIPRPDVEVNVGTTTVRVLQGDLAAYVPNHPVHLVLVQAGGKVELITQRTDTAGRASFDKMTPDGSVAYYALTMLGDDRLESQLMIPDRMQGFRLMLAGRKLENGVPQGDPVDDALSAEEPMQVPAGEVWVMVGGETAAEVDVELVRVPAVGQTAEVVTTTKASAGGGEGLMARFKDVVVDDRVYVARVNSGGRAFVSRPFMLKAQAGVGRTILLASQLVVSAHVALELDDDALRCQMQFQVLNYSGGPVDAGKDGLVLPLPLGVSGGRLAEGSRAKLEEGKGVVLRGALPPGSTDVVVGFRLPFEDRRVSIALPAPHGLFQSSFIIEDIAGARIVPPAGTTPRSMTTDTGRRFSVMRLERAVPGQVLHLALEDLPARPASERLIRLGAGLIVGLLLLGVFVLVVWPKTLGLGAGPADRAGGAAADQDQGGGADLDPKARAARRQELAKTRESLYDKLVALEQKRQRDAIDASAYESERQQLVSRLALVLRQLDQLDA
jgi:hypothetical protein